MTGAVVCTTEGWQLVAMGGVMTWSCSRWWNLLLGTAMCTAGPTRKDFGLIDERGRASCIGVAAPPLYDDGDAAQRS